MNLSRNQLLNVTWVPVHLTIILIELNVALLGKNRTRFVKITYMCAKNHTCVLKITHVCLKSHMCGKNHTCVEFTTQEDVLEVVG